MRKALRHAKIKEIIGKYDIETQEDLVMRLNEMDCNVTQSTVSRDIRDLKLTKVSYEGGRQKYTYGSHDTQVLNDKYSRVLKDGFVSMDTAPGLLVVKTVSGMAMAVAAAIDAMKMEEIIGSIAGDDTIMCAVKTTEDAQMVMNSIEQIIKH
ncbi:MAG: arginine repressor [Thermoflexaceae bacterium]|nr:arginine repressor [Thermoflexaceae bacterium]